MTRADERLRRQQRQLELAPNDHEAWFKLTIERSRVEGPKVFLEVLQDRKLWQLAPHSIQDQAIQEVAKRLGNHYQWQDTKVFQCEGLSHRLASFRHPELGATFRLLPGDNLTLGIKDPEAALEAARSFSENYAQEWIDWSTPLLPVTIKPFLIGPYLLRQSIWSKLDSSIEANFPGPQKPIENVCWDKANEWLEVAGLRFPTEYEWEYACRAGTNTLLYWGKDYSKRQYDPFNPTDDGETHDVEARKHLANAFGIVDMLGNVWEWVSDPWQDRYPPNQETAITDPENTDLRVIRGGAWYSRGLVCGSRNSYNRSSPDRDLGFRAALSIPNL